LLGCCVGLCWGVVGCWGGGGVFEHTKLAPRYATVMHCKVNRSRYRTGVDQRVGRGIALLFHDRGIRRGLGVSSTPRPHFTAGKDPVPIVR